MSLRNLFSLRQTLSHKPAPNTDLLRKESRGYTPRGISWARPDCFPGPESVGGEAAARRAMDCGWYNAAQAAG